MASLEESFGMSAEENRKRIAKLQRQERAERKKRRENRHPSVYAEQAYLGLEAARQIEIETGHDEGLERFAPRDSDGSYSTLDLVIDNDSFELVRDQKQNYYVRYTRKFLRYQIKKFGKAAPRYIHKKPFNWFEGMRFFDSLSETSLLSS